MVEGDGFNYVDVARNIATGQGITQSTLDFNEPGFAITDEIPAPLTAQPPSYPIIIWLLSLTGLSPVLAALLISSLCYGFILLASYYLLGSIYNQRIAFIAVLGLILFEPLHSISTEAWSENLGVAFVLASLYFTVRSAKTDQGLSWWPLLAGLTAGLAFATRYGLLPVFLVGVLGLINWANWRKTGQRLCLYVAGLAVPVSLVLAHNLLVSGTLMGKDRLPSTQGLVTNIKDALGATLGSFFPKTLSTPLQLLLVGAIITVCLGNLLYRKRLVETLKEVFVSNQSYLLVLWSLLYLGLVIYLRTRTHFDNIYIRLAFPATITLFLLFIILVIKAAGFNLKPVLKYGPYLALLILAFAVGREAVGFATTPPYNEQQAIAKDNLTWATQNVTARDLVIGTTDVVEVPYYISGAKALSFSPYPFNEYPDYDKITAYVNAHCANYSHIYFMLRNQTDSTEQLEAEYGQFMVDLVKGQLQKYPNFKPVAHLDQTDIFSVQCSGAA